MERAEKKKRKAAKAAARERAALGNKGTGHNRHSSLTTMADVRTLSSNVMATFTSSVASMVRNRNITLTRRRTARSGSPAYTEDVEEGIHSAGHDEAMKMSDLRSSSRPGTPRPTEDHIELSTSPERNIGTTSETSSTSATPSLHPPHSLGQALTFPATWLHVYIRRLRRAHEDATKSQALQRAELREKIFASSEAGPSRLPDDPSSQAHHSGRAQRLGRSAAVAEAAVIEEDGTGWGLGSFGIREHRESSQRIQSARDQLRENRLLDPTDEEDGAGDSGKATAGDVGRDGDAGGDEGWEDVVESNSSGNGQDQMTGPELKEKPPETKAGSGSGWSWWGPLRDWRLSDRSVF